MEGNRENRIPGGQDGVSTADSPEKWSGERINDVDTTQHMPSEPGCAGHSSSEILRKYVKHVGISRKRTRHHCLSYPGIA